MQIYETKERVQLPQDLFETPIWPPWRHVKTLYCFFAVLVAAAEDPAFVTPPYSTVARGKTPYTGRLRRKG